MKALKRIVTETIEEFNLEFTGITLLSKAEYEIDKDIIPDRSAWWWLRTTAFRQSHRYIFNGIAVINIEDPGLPYVIPDYKFGGVRPALCIKNFDSSGLYRGDKLEMVGYTWTVLSNGLALCNYIVGEMAFQTNYDINKPIDYEKSDIKKWLLEWSKANGIEFVAE